MKNKISILMILVILLSISTNIYAEELNDIENHWAKENIQNLIDRKVITGYPDGTFKPNNEVTRAEAIKMLLVSLGGNIKNSTEGHWAANYYKNAIKDEYVLEDEFDNIDKPITRAELARILSRALKEVPENYISFESQVTDLNEIVQVFKANGIIKSWAEAPKGTTTTEVDLSNTKYDYFDTKNHILKVYASGVITGYPDGRFKAENSVTRAEASTMFVRFLEPDNRIISESKPSKIDFIEPELKVFYYMSLDSYDYFGIQLNNWEDYREHSEYYFTTECISHTEINKVNWKGLDGKFSNKVRDMVTDSKSNIDGKFNARFYGDGQIYGLWSFYSWKPLNSNTHFDIKDGEMMKYKVTVTDGKSLKEYFLDIEFKNKEFRYNNI